VVFKEVPSFRQPSAGNSFSSTQGNSWQCQAPPRISTRLAMLQTPTLSAMAAQREKQREEAARSHAVQKQMSLCTDSMETSRSRRLNGCREKLENIVASNRFELFFATMIICNSVFVGVQVEYLVTNRVSRTPQEFYVIQVTFATSFLVELVMRMAAGGREFFSFSGQWQWNALDVLIVLSSIFEVVMDTLYWVKGGSDAGGSSSAIEGASNVRIIRILRIARLMRIIRVARILRFIHALRTFIYSIIATLRALIWALLLLCMILYVFGILLAQTAGDYLIDVEAKSQASGVDDCDYNAQGEMVNAAGCAATTDIAKYWGTLPRAMFTLFKSISGGVSWDVVVHPMAVLGGLWVGIFTCFISFTYFAVLNVVTGIFCQSAIETAQQNEDLMVQSQIAQREVYVNRIQRLFEEIDEDGSGIVTIDELEARINDDAVQAVFASMDIDTSDAWMLFKLLDSDEGNELDVEEFVMGLMKLKGNAKRADLVEIHAALKRLTLVNCDILHKLEYVEYGQVQLNHLAEATHKLSAEIRSARRDSGRLMPPVQAQAPVHCSTAVTNRWTPSRRIEREFSEWSLGEFTPQTSGPPAGGPNSNADFMPNSDKGARPLPHKGDDQPINSTGGEELS